MPSYLHDVVHIKLCTQLLLFTTNPSATMRAFSNESLPTTPTSRSYPSSVTNKSAGQATISKMRPISYHHLCTSTPVSTASVPSTSATATSTLCSNSGEQLVSIKCYR